MTPLLEPEALDASAPASPAEGAPLVPLHPVCAESRDFFAIHLHSSAYEAQQRLASDRAVNAAVMVLRRRHRLTYASAYALLVETSTRRGLSLDDLALGLLEEADRTGGQAPPAF